MLSPILTVLHLTKYQRQLKLATSTSPLSGVLTPITGGATHTGRQDYGWKPLLEKQGKDPLLLPKQLYRWINHNNTPALFIPYILPYSKNLKPKSTSWQAYFGPIKGKTIVIEGIEIGVLIYTRGCQNGNNTDLRVVIFTVIRMVDAV